MRRPPDRSACLPPRPPSQVPDATEKGKGHDQDRSDHCRIRQRRRRGIAGGYQDALGAWRLFRQRGHGRDRPEHPARDSDPSRPPGPDPRPDQRGPGRYRRPCHQDRHDRVAGGGRRGRGIVARLRHPRRAGSGDDREVGRCPGIGGRRGRADPRLAAPRPCADPQPARGRAPAGPGPRRFRRPGDRAGTGASRAWPAPCADEGRSCRGKPLHRPSGRAGRGGALRIGADRHPAHAWHGMFAGLGHRGGTGAGAFDRGCCGPGA